MERHSPRDIFSTLVTTVITCVLLWCSLNMGAGAHYVCVENCVWEPISINSTTLSVTCNLTTLQGKPNPINYSLIMPGYNVRLSIRCTDASVQISHTNSLLEGSFKHLRNLQSLSIENCHLDRLPLKTFQGLEGLKNLTVKTLNTERSHLSLSVSPKTLLPLRQLISLDFSENNIEWLPNKFLCGLNHLRFVNLTGNKFADVSNMGLSSVTSCSLMVTRLDVGFNQLKALPERGFASLTRLEELRLDHNQLARAEPTALRGLAQLLHLDMAHNVLVALPAALFRPTPRLLELYLRNNSLSALSPALLSELKELSILDLAYNQLSSMSWLGNPDGSSNLTRLRELDLSHNRLISLKSGVFHALESLQILQLQNNLIEHVANGTFQGLSMLQSLVLSNNRLQHIGFRMMFGLGLSLTALHLDGNYVESIYDDAFQDMSMLQELSLAGNRLIVVPQAVSVLNMLNSLNLSDNNIQDITNAPYQGLTRLFALDFVGNNIRSIRKGAFNNLPSVRILYLARNNIQAIEKGAFDNLPNLYFLRLDSNIIHDVSSLFTSLHDLIMLNISVNRIRWFDYAMVPAGLQWLDIHNNQIEALGNYYGLEHVLKLRTIDASFNRLTFLNSSSLPNSIENVFLTHNHLQRIQPFTFLEKPNLARVDLTHNQLQVLSMSTLCLSASPSRQPFPEFKIANNPYLCDCRMEWLQGLQNFSTQIITSMHSAYPRLYPRIDDLSSVMCKLGFSKRTRILPLVKAKSAEFLCEIKSHCFSVCDCCEFEACDCRMVCPDNCSCFHDQSWQTNIVDCGGRNQGVIPKELPIEVSELYIDGNQIPTLYPHLFVNMGSLKVLFLNNSNIVSIKNQSFASLRQLRVLHLENNQISVFSGHEFNGLTKLVELYLSNNRLHYIDNSTFAELQSLEVLRLDRNRLIDMSLWSLHCNPRLTEIYLAANPWSCNCYFTEELAQFIVSHKNTACDLFQMTCVYNATRTLPLWEPNMIDCHRLPNVTIPQFQPQFQIRRIEDFLSVAFIIGGVVLFALFIIAIVLTPSRRRISVCLFSRYGVRMFHRASAEGDKLFDAFVSYSKKDEAFVTQVLAPELECGRPPYRLCLHYRDLSHTGTYLQEAIREAVDSSRGTIVVLSEHFLKNGSCRHEFKSAHLEVLNNSHHKLVVIFLGRVSYRELDPDIRAWLKHSTFLHWGEKDFWNKLRYAMPDVRHRNKAIRSDLNLVAAYI